MPVSDPDVSRPRPIRDARFLEAGRREIARGGAATIDWVRKKFAYQIVFVRGLGRWKNVLIAVIFLSGLALSLPLFRPSRQNFPPDEHHDAADVGSRCLLDRTREPTRA